MVGSRNSAVEIRELTIDHLLRMDLSKLAIYVNDFAFSAFADGKYIAAGGIIDLYWPGRGHAWFAKSKLVDEWNWRWWPPITRAVKKAVELAFDSGKYRRIEMTIYDRDDAAKRWAGHLGFKAEGFHQKFMQDGSDGWTYGRIE